MHRSRRPDPPLDRSSNTGSTVTLRDIHRSAEQVLEVTPRIVSPGQQVEVEARALEPADHSVYRVRAMGSGDALVIQHSKQADLSPFSGLLISRSTTAGMPPRILYNMGPLEEGSIQLLEVERMLEAVVQHACVR